jgi:hypothetical protein
VFGCVGFAYQLASSGTLRRLIAAMDEDDFRRWMRSVKSVFRGLNESKRRCVMVTLAAASPPSEIAGFVKDLMPLTKRDFVNLLPVELVDHLLSFLNCKSALVACCVGIFVYTYVEVPVIFDANDYYIYVLCSNTCRVIREIMLLCIVAVLSRIIIAAALLCLDLIGS